MGYSSERGDTEAILMHARINFKKERSGHRKRIWSSFLQGMAPLRRKRCDDM